jgi:hypothetical protein
VTAIALAEWNQAREAGVPAFAVGPVARPVLYLDRAEAAADELDGTYIVWQGCTGRQVLTAEAAAEAGAFAELEAEV